MDNFDLKKFLAEGKLHEAMSPQDVVDIADTVAEEFTIESADEGDFLVYSVGKMDADDMSFELDTDVTSQTPKSIDTRGVGEGWGGIFRIKPTEDGYEVRNAEKGGLVAMIDNAGNFKMLSADESRAELLGEPDVDYKNDEPDFNRYMEEGETLNEGLFDTVKDKLLAAKDKIMSKVSPEAIAMFKDKVEQALGKPASELGVEDLTLANAKKVGALVKDQLSEGETLNEGLKDTIGSILGVLGLATAVAAGIGGAVWISVAGLIMLFVSWMTSLEESLNEAEEVKEYSSKMKKSELKEMIRAAFLNEAEGDEEEDVEAEIEADVDVDVDADMDMDMDAGEDGINVKQDADAELGGTVGDVQDNLEAALEAARKLGDEKLEDQIGNTLTFFTRTHVVKEEVSEAFGDEYEWGDTTYGDNQGLEVKSLAKQLYLGFKKMGARARLEANRKKAPIGAEWGKDGLDQIDVLIWVGDSHKGYMVTVDLIGDKAMSFADKIMNDPKFSKFEFSKREIKTWGGQKGIELDVKPKVSRKGGVSVTETESLNESFTRMQKIAGIKK